MIDPPHPFPVVRQCQLLKLARSTAYDQPTPVSETTLVVMRRIDELHLKYPVAGARMLRDLLWQEGRAIGRRQVATLRRRMGIEALYRKPCSSSDCGRASNTRRSICTRTTPSRPRTRGWHAI
jgi:putative transposase